METTTDTATEVSTRQTFPRGSARPKKLRNGRWGATYEGCAEVGQSITITTRKGKQWQTVVSRVLWTDGTVSIVTTRSEKPSARRCVTDGNCSSFGTGLHCGGDDCDGY